jgi:hypothetical protein
VIGLLIPLTQLPEESLWHTPFSQLCPGKVAQNLQASGWTISSCVKWSLFSRWTIDGIHPISSDHYFSYHMLPPYTRGWLLQTKSAISGCFVVSLHARNQASKPSTEMELVWWSRVARLTTCEQGRPASKIVACVILHISSWRYGRIVTLFWCTNDDCNLCVWFCISRDMLVWLSLCSAIFLYDLPTYLQAWRSTSRWGLAKPCLFWCNMCVCVCVIFLLKRHACVIISVQYNFLYDLPTHLQSL